jgi:hypothetical protein
MAALRIRATVFALIFLLMLLAVVVPTSPIMGGN